MIASFIYTQCASPGPFKSQAGYKIKSAHLITSEGATHSAQNAPEAEPLLNQAIGSLPQYTAPEIGPFTTELEFRALPRKWVYLPVRDKADADSTLPSQFVFARMFTSGESNGRPNNIFHQGFVRKNDQNSVHALQKLAEDLSQLPHVTPADFATWQDWLNPRGDVELETAQLEDDNPPIPGMTRVEWNRAIERLFDGDEDLTIANLRNVEQELLQIFPGVALIGSERDDEFLQWVSVVTHLIPAEGAWKTPFVSEGKIPKRREEKEYFGFRGVKPAAALGAKAVDDIGWAQLVKHVVEAGLLIKIEDRIHALGLNAAATLRGRAKLAELPLAVATLDLDEFANDQVSDVLAAFQKFWMSVNFQELCASTATTEVGEVLRERLSSYFSAPNSVLAHSPQFRDAWISAVSPPARDGGWLRKRLSS